MQRTWVNSATILIPAVAGIGLAASDDASAGATLKIDETKWVSIGAGLRTSFNSFEDSAPSGSDDSKDFLLDSIRLYLSGQIHEYIKLTFNTERRDDEDIRVLDAIAQFEFSPGFNIWAGRFLPPSDRANLSGPYYANSWNFPLVQAYPAVFAGRDDGVALWGETTLGSIQFKYAGGAFQGCADSNPCDTGANDEDSLLYAGRVVFNFWDPEPGYYNASTYYGAKDILAVGMAAMSQSDAVGTPGDAKDFFGYNIDLLMEKKLSNSGVVSLEGAYYDYDLDDATTTGGLVQGDGYYVLGAYLLPGKVGIGQLQPHARYQSLDLDSGVETEQWEIGLNYIIDGHNARVSFTYGEREVDAPGGDTDTDFFQVGLQLQI
ncbi:MAG: hypothetical protein KDH88_14240 [Chromatiales bacterium]|nr:hypothetical protein [Chromatiales bacterium]